MIDVYCWRVPEHRHFDVFLRGTIIVYRPSDPFLYICSCVVRAWHIELLNIFWSRWFGLNLYIYQLNMHTQTIYSHLLKECSFHAPFLIIQFSMISEQISSMAFMFEFVLSLWQVQNFTIYIHLKYVRSSFAIDHL